jgi:hypothetical protein
MALKRLQKKKKNRTQKHICNPILYKIYTINLMFKKRLKTRLPLIMAKPPLQKMLVTCRLLVEK